MSDEPEPPKSWAFEPGHKITRTGVQNRKTRELIDFAKTVLDKHSHVVEEFLTSPNQRIRLDAWMFLFKYRWGLPVARVEVDMHAAARRLAEDAGVPLDVLLATAKQLVDEQEMAPLDTGDEPPPDA
jgi:hypothetical protein